MKIDFPYKKYKIMNKKEVAPSTFLFQISGEINFSPGQFVQVMIPNIGEATFAPCSDPENRKWFELCVRVAGNTTRAVTEMNPGENLCIRGPLGNGWPYGELLEKNIMIIAGGIGLIPLRPLLFQLNRYKTEFKNIYLLLGCRTTDHLLFKNDNWKFKYNKTAAEKGEFNYKCHKGMVTDLVETVTIPKKTKILLCGPEIMYRPVIKILNEKGIRNSEIYVSLERRMECGIGLCQHCNVGKNLVCKDGPVFRWDNIEEDLGK